MVQAKKKPEKKSSKKGGKLAVLAEEGKLTPAGKKAFAPGGPYGPKPKKA